MEYSEIILQLNNWYVKNFIFFPRLIFLKIFNDFIRPSELLENM
jgi:hypothetical protein